MKEDVVSYTHERHRQQIIKAYLQAGAVRCRVSAWVKNPQIKMCLV